MPDPMDELSNFEPGVPVSPIPAAEVRRRGDRLRRRNTALAVGGAVAAIAADRRPGRGRRSAATTTAGRRSLRPADDLTTGRRC